MKTEVAINRTIKYQIFSKYKDHGKYYFHHPAGLISFWSNEVKFVGPWLTTGELIERYYLFFN